ncbi:MAG: penicillin-binding protein transpeptidase [Anaerocolumna sp.]|nr:penicillin-binding protein transpeptidase [Anaerocolumna sp.]
MRREEKEKLKQKKKKSKSKSKAVLNEQYSSQTAPEGIFENEDEQVKQIQKVKKKKEKTNREIILVMYIFVGLFFLVIGYFTNFMINQSSEVINNTYNKRQDLLAEQILRGDIISSDGKVLAHTTTDKKGNETRVYPYKDIFVHIVGQFNKGKTGLESSENFHLLTSNNGTISKVFKELSGEKNIGDNIVTTLDTNLQQAAYDALGDNRGAVVVMEPSSGKILAMVSKPDYDPNKIDSIWNSLVENSNNDSALLNRATQGLYPPGSTFKILTTLEYIRENPNYKDYEYNCVGKGIFNSVTINCYNNKKHGEEDLMHSFAHSCNASFANIGTTLKMSSFRKLCETFLFNTALPTNLPSKKSSFVLSTSTDPSLIPQTVIGQGQTQITPLHNAMIVSAIANGGVMMKPYVVDSIENQGGTVIKKYLPEISGAVMTPGEAGILTTFMEETIKSGTATSLKNSNYTVAGKTGSAEHTQGKPAHAWFVGFASTDKPEIAVSVIVESVGTGSEYAVPIAKKIFKTYYNNK